MHEVKLNLGFQALRGQFGPWERMAKGMALYKGICGEVKPIWLHVEMGYKLESFL